MWRVLVVFGVLVGATVFGLWWRARNGRIRAHAAKDVHAVEEARAARHRQHWSALGFDPGESAVTLVQFSTAFCQPCRATRSILADVAAARDGVRHVEVDAESHLDIVRALEVWRTPTVLVVDRAGRIVGRASGQPRKADVTAVAAAVLEA